MHSWHIAIPLRSIFAALCSNGVAWEKANVESMAEVELRRSEWLRCDERRQAQGDLKANSRHTLFHSHTTTDISLSCDSKRAQIEVDERSR